MSRSNSLKIGCCASKIKAVTPILNLKKLLTIKYPQTMIRWRIDVIWPVLTWKTPCKGANSPRLQNQPQLAKKNPPSSMILWHWIIRRLLPKPSNNRHRSRNRAKHNCIGRHWNNQTWLANLRRVLLARKTWLTGSTGWSLKITRTSSWMLSRA